MTKGYAAPLEKVGTCYRHQTPRRMRSIGFAPWKPLPPVIDDPDWDVETFADQEERLGRSVPDDRGEM
jgi:hypothetical protein